jgi:hypothetical protein
MKGVTNMVLEGSAQLDAQCIATFVQMEENKNKLELKKWL